MSTTAATRHVHFLGICGYAVSGAALLAQQLGYRVTGSDEHAYPPTTDTLDRAGIPWINRHDPANLDRYGRPDLVVVGNNVREGNAEWAAAQARGIAITSEPEFYTELTGDRLRIAVCGTHGKTTTAALLALMLDRAGLRPGFRLGAVSRDFGATARLGDGAPFVIEGDEYTTAPWDPRPKFLHARPLAACVTRLELDHPDVYPTLEAYRAPFRELARTMPAEGLLVLFADDPECVALGEHAACRVETYGATVTADWCILDTTPATGDELQRFSVLHQPGDERFDVLLSVPGSHNRQNAVAALALARFAGARLEPCLDACRSFKGASRRFEIVGTAGGVTVVDDYAHHPTEVAVTVAAARQRFPGRRLLVVDVPHTYSRTLEFLDDYGDVFAGAEVVILGPIEAARERHLSTTVSSADIAGRVRTGGVKSLVVDSSDAALTTVIERAQPGDVVLCISVGGFDGLAQRLLVSLGERHGGG